MTALQFLTGPDGCCSNKELLELNKTDPETLKQLKEWAIAEMTAKGIPVDAPKK